MTHYDHAVDDAVDEGDADDGGAHGAHDGVK